MHKNIGRKRVTFHLFLILTGFIGLSLLFSAMPVCAQPLVDLNSASEKDLQSIKGIGPVMAKKIIAGRPYKSVDDLKKAGVSEKTISSMKPYVTVGGGAAPAKPAPAAKVAPPAKTPPAQQPVPPAAPAKKAMKETPARTAPAPVSAPAAKTPAKAPAKPPFKLAPGQKVNLNTATLEQLEALPEIGPVKAQAIIAGRPYKDPQDIMKIRGIKEGTYNKIKDFITVR